MRFERTQNYVSMVFLLLITIVVATPYLSYAGEIKPPLDKAIAESNSGEMIKVIALLADRIDNEELNQSLIARDATLQQRHYEVISSLQQKATQTQSSVLAKLNELERDGIVKGIRNFWIANIIAFDGTAEAIEKIAAMPQIEKVQLDIPVELIKPIIEENNEQPLIASHEQGLEVMNVPAVWALGYTGAGRLVSNIDTGVDGTHPALTARWRGNNGYDADECWYDPYGGTTSPEDYGEHGTHTMGTICGRSASTYDTIGVAIDAQWIACAAIDNGATTAQIIASFEFIADPDGDPSTVSDMPDVCSNSWGWSPFWEGYEHCDDTFWDAMDGCENAGCVVVFAAGNEGEEGSNSLRTPADRASSYYNAFSVGAIDGHTSGYPIAYFSSLGPCECASGDMIIKPECVAPGYNIRSSVPGGSYESGWSGTSMACPHIAGTVAILRQVNPDLNVDQIKSIILQACVDLGNSGEDNTYGHGYLNLLTAVQLAGIDFAYVDGYVRDAVYNTALPAAVSVPGTLYSTTAGSDGHYFLAILPDTLLTIQASYNGYASEQASVTVSANDTANYDFYLDPPLIAYDPTSYSVSVAPGESAERDLTISNTGAGTLSYSITTEIDATLALNDGRSLPVTIKPSSAKSEPLGYLPLQSNKPEAIAEPYYPPVITDTGGPDAYGHTWIDSDESGGPSLSWIDISSSGTELSFSDDDYEQVSIGFTFPFYDNSYSSLYVSSNGLVSFGSGSTDYTNDDIPDTDTPNNYIAAFWDDLSPQNGGPVYYYYDSSTSRFIVSWVDVPIYNWSGGAGSLTFQIVLYPNGTIEMNFDTMDGGSIGLTSGTIGIESDDGADGLAIAYNQSYMHSDLSIRISGYSWISASPLSGTVASGYTDTVIVTFDASELAAGTYTGNINLINNSANDADIDIPVTLYVTDSSTPIIELSASAIYDTLSSGGSTTQTLTISNTGDTTLTYSLADTSAWLSESPISGSITAGGNAVITISFNAAALTDGDYTSTIIVSSNDPNNPTINLPVYLHVYTPAPIIGLSPAAIYDTLSSGGSANHNLIITNTGDAALTFSLSDTSAWLSESPISGSIAAGGRDTIIVTLSASSLVDSSYTGRIVITSNDSDNPTINLPVYLLVYTPIPEIALSAAEFYDTLYTGYSTTQSLTISNNGNAVLTYSLADTNSWLSESQTSGSIVAGGNASIIITMNAGSLSEGDYIGTIAVTSNDPDEPSIDLPVYLHVVYIIAAIAYVPGDANMINGSWPPMVIGGDVTYLVNYFRGINSPCLLSGFFCAADANGDCQVIGSDVTKMVSYFRGITSLSYCANFTPLWLTPNDCPTDAPSGWPNCEVPVAKPHIE